MTFTAPEVKEPNNRPITTTANLLIETDWEGVTIYTKMIDVVVAPTEKRSPT